MTSLSQIRLGTRASSLARWQAEWVGARLAELGIRVLQAPITTSGDRLQQQSIGEVGGQGLFTKEIQRALLDRQIDLAVHKIGRAHV
jgi:hydroxymethylbilane synthase